jgi:flagellar motor switch protein FliN
MTDDLDKNLPPDAAPPEDEAVASQTADGDAQEGDLEQLAADIDGGGDDVFKIVNDGDANEGDAEAEMLAMLEGLPPDAPKASPDEINFGSASLSNAEFQHLQQPSGAPSPSNIDLLMDVDLPVSIELGRTKMSIASILELGPGSVVELNKLAGEPVDLLVNYKVVARGEVVVVDENFGLRITQLMTPEERLRALAEE